MKKTTEAQKRANAKYDKENTKLVQIKLNKNTDSDILELFEGLTNRQGYIKRLIRNDIKNNKEVYKMYATTEFKVYYTVINKYNEELNREMNVFAATKEEAEKEVLKANENAKITKVVEADKIKHFRVHVFDHIEHWYDVYAETKEEVEQRYANDPSVKAYEVFE